jgi:citrate lyase subunit beta/citryl-CoA lyase
MSNSEQSEAGFLSKSDCIVRYEPSQEPLSIEVRSSVRALFETQIRQCILRIFQEFDVTKGRIAIEDDGALDLVISARVEAVLRQAGYLSQMKTMSPEKGKYGVSLVSPNGAGFTQSSRRVRLYMPGDQPHFAVNADFYGADILIFDLEDSVAQSRKCEARILVRRFLENSFLFRKSARAVRINPLSTEESMLDLAEIVPAKPDIVLLPKCETADDIKRLDALLSEHENRCGTMPGGIQIMPIIETAKGVLAARGIACASKRTSGLCFGYEDFSRDIQSSSDILGKALLMHSGSMHQIDSLLARETIVLAARAAGIEPYDSSYGDIDNTEGLLMSCYEARALGFAGKSVIHPSQIPYVRKAFMPTAEELHQAQAIVAAYEESFSTGKGAIVVDGQMVDIPVVEKARRIIEEFDYGE